MTIGVPASPPSAIAASRGTEPRNGVSSSRAVRSPPPLLKTWVSWPQFGQTKVDMFSTIPSTGTSILRNIASPLRASKRATSWGVVTITAPATGTFWITESWASPVPGRHVENQEVQSAPVDVAEHLFDRLHHHRTAPDDRRVGVENEAQRHQLDAVLLERPNAVADDDRSLVDAEHRRQRRAVDVDVEEADTVSGLPEGDRQIARHGRLADTALAARHRDH